VTAGERGDVPAGEYGGVTAGECCTGMSMFIIIITTLRTQNTRKFTFFLKKEFGDAGSLPSCNGVGILAAVVVVPRQAEVGQLHNAVLTQQHIRWL
jgi:hypothetical protein